jgi:predicted lipoprotein with Yx(FWY)xxD motif
MNATRPSKRLGIFLALVLSFLLAACSTSTPEPSAGGATNFSVYVLAINETNTLSATPWTLERPAGDPTLGQGKAIVTDTPLVGERVHTMDVSARPGEKLMLNVKTAQGTSLDLSPIELFDAQGQALDGEVLREQGVAVVVEVAAPETELQASAVRRVLTFSNISLSGASEVPAVTTSATGQAFALLINKHAFVIGSFQKLQGSLLSEGTAHIHRGAAGTNGPVVFELSAAADQAGNGFVIGLSRLSKDDVTNFEKGLLYLNIHSSFSKTGEIRGQLSSEQAAPAKQELRLSSAVNELYGDYVIDADGNSLYLFTNDVRGSNTSVCNGACAVTWPPLTFNPEQETLAIAASSTLNAALLGSFKREDGTTQATYNGWPLHRFSKDVTPGDTNGQGVGGIWFLLKPDGSRNLPPAAQISLTTRENETFGTYLTDTVGNSLYLFSKDVRGSNTSVCNGACAVTWPPLTLESGATAVVVANKGLEAALLGSFKREDGSTQVTYNGWPLHFYEPDGVPGDIKGQNIGEVWFIVSPSGEAIRTAK